LVYRSLDNAGEKTFLLSPPLVHGFSFTITEILNIQIVSKAAHVVRKQPDADAITTSRIPKGKRISGVRRFYVYMLKPNSQYA
jgi:hypothetical protein